MCFFCVFFVFFCVFLCFFVSRHDTKKTPKNFCVKTWHKRDTRKFFVLHITDDSALSPEVRKSAQNLTDALVLDRKKLCLMVIGSILPLILSLGHSHLLLFCKKLCCHYISYSTDLYSYFTSTMDQAKLWMKWLFIISLLLP